MVSKGPVGDLTPEEEELQASIDRSWETARRLARTDEARAAADAEHYDLRSLRHKDPATYEGLLRSHRTGERLRADPAFVEQLRQRCVELDARRSA